MRFVNYRWLIVCLGVAGWAAGSGFATSLPAQQTNYRCKSPSACEAGSSTWCKVTCFEGGCHCELS